MSGTNAPQEVEGGITSSIPTTQFMLLDREGMLFQRSHICFNKMGGVREMGNGVEVGVVLFMQRKIKPVQPSYLISPTDWYAAMMKSTM